MFSLIFRLPHVAWHLSRGGVLGHLSQVSILPAWLRSFLLFLDRLLARRNPERPGIALVHALTALGPGFIKFGQALSTRADLIGADVARDLATLQDRLAPFSSRAAKQIITRELGEVGSVFSDFDDDAFAAASIAQVHFAKLADGRDVAVKILRPGIRAKLERDFAFFRSVAKLVETIAPDTKRLKLSYAVGQFAHYADIELDLRLEAASAAKLKDNHADDAGIVIPVIEWNLTTEHVLVMERILGTRIDDREGLLAKGHDIDAITKVAAASFFYQVFRDGFFHADMHPGNIFIRDDGMLVPIDFGIMGDLSLEDRLFLARLLTAILDKDYDMVARLHRDAGMIGDDVSLAGFSQAIRAVTEPVMDQPMGDVSLGTVLGQIFGLARRYHIEVQPQFTLLQKTMMMAEGVARQLNPDANMWPLARDLAAEWAEEQDGLFTQLNAIADKALTLGLRLPGLIDRAEAYFDRDHTPEPPQKAGISRVSAIILVLLASAVMYFIVS
jgi:ubiquinone biosynthesis protein